ncbi:MAG: DNA methyltransferase, partial [Thermoanaerobaculia bacterium]
MDLPTFLPKWRASGASERANKDSFLRDLCDVLGVPHPDAKSGDPDRDRYVFEREAVLHHGGERHSVGFIDLYKHGCFVLEAKQGSDVESKKIGTARRGTPGWHVAMQEAFGQARMYTDTIEPPPPFVIVTDIGYCFDLYASFDGTRNNRKFPDALSSRIPIESLEREPKHLDTLRAIFTDPHSLDPAKRSVTVTREIAGYLANVARSLGDAGHDPVKVAQFLMRCLFTMFVEDIGLLQQPVFTSALKERWLEHPDMFPGEVESLWQRMNAGGFLFGAGNIWRFNGGLFTDPTALPLTRQQLGVLALAAQSDWAHVEPAIFGTLLERALDPKERHRLGAHYTPRAYVERLVRPTIEEPLRAEWDNVRAQVLTLAATEDRKALAEARKIVYAFYDRLTRIRVLDPACGSGNFLFVALDLFKRIENEIIDLLENLGGDRSIVTFGRMVTPEQFLGIEIKEWAKEITELVLWIGWLQWQIRTRGYRNHPEEPILRDYHNIERRDAVLAYDDQVPLLDDEGEVVTRWDGEKMKVHPVTGEEVPDDTARVPVYRYVNPKKAEWPEADFVVGNPPFIGNWRMRSVLGDGYTEALRSSYDDVPESVDYVMYWWDKAAELTRAGKLRRFGFITTN